MYKLYSVYCMLYIGISLNIYKQYIYKLHTVQLGLCTKLKFMYRKIVRVENFKQQVVAGTKYTFNLVLASHKDNVSIFHSESRLSDCIFILNLKQLFIIKRFI